MIRNLQVISETLLTGVKSDNCEVSSVLLINRESVAKLKENLLNHPYETQCLKGVVKVVDEEEKAVNPELFIAIQELSFDGIDLDRKDQIPTVVMKCVNQ